MQSLWKIILGILLVVQVSHGIEHNLPDNVEIIDPKSLGLAGADLDKFLGNVKLLPLAGNGLPKEVGGAKTQILTVGFEGDEGLNLDDFELPSLDGVPDADKSVAAAAFNRFQEFFKNPNKSKVIVDDEDLAEETTKAAANESATSPTASTTVGVTLTTTPADSTTSTATTVRPRRPVYRPRGSTADPSTYLNRNRHKVRRPVKFRSTTTASPPGPDDATTFDPSQFQSHENMQIFGARFQPQQVDDYSGVIRDFASGRQQPFTRRPSAPPRDDSSEGAPQGLLGFTPVRQAGHNGPPIFDFDSFHPTKKPTTKQRPTDFVSATTERQEKTDGGSQIIDYTRPNLNPNTGNNRFLSNRPRGNQDTYDQVPSNQQKPQPPKRLRTSASSSFNVAPPSPQPQNFSPYNQENQQQNPISQVSPSSEEIPKKIVKPSFEIISAEPVDTHTVSSKVPFRFPSSEEDHFPIFRDPIPDGRSPLPPPPQQPGQQQPPSPLRPQSFSSQTPVSAPIDTPTPPAHATAPEQIRFFQQEYQRMAKLKKEHEERAAQLQRELRLQQERTFQLQQQLRFQPQQETQQQRPNVPQSPPPQQRPQFPPKPQPPVNRQQGPQGPVPVPSQQQVQSQVRFNLAPQQQRLPVIPPPPRQIVPLVPVAHQQMPVRPLPPAYNPNVRPNAFVQPPVLPNPNFLQPHINEKFYGGPETPKHIVRNPVNLFGNNVPNKHQQIYPLTTPENSRPSLQNNRFVPSQPFQQGPFPSQNFNPYGSFQPQQPPRGPLSNPHQFSSRSLEGEDGPQPGGTQLHPAKLIGTFSLSSQKQRGSSATVAQAAAFS